MVTSELHTLALEIAHDISRSDIECFCTWINDDDGARVWFDLDSASGDDTERELVARAERFLELAGRLERSADNPRIVRIKPLDASKQPRGVAFLPRNAELDDAIDAAMAKDGA